MIAAVAKMQWLWHNGDYTVARTQRLHQTVPWPRLVNMEDSKEVGKAMPVSRRRRPGRATMSTRRRQELIPEVGHDGHEEQARPGHKFKNTNRRPGRAMMSIRRRQGPATMALRRRPGRVTTSTHAKP